MGALAVVEAQIAIQVLLELSDALIQGVAKSGGEELFLDGAVEALADTVGLTAQDGWLWRHKAKRVEITIVDATVSKPGGFQISIEDGQRLLARR